MFIRTFRCIVNHNFYTVCFNLTLVMKNIYLKLKKKNYNVNSKNIEELTARLKNF